MDTGNELQNLLSDYVTGTLSYAETLRDFCDQEQIWDHERKRELEKLRDIKDKQQDKELGAVLKDTLVGLKELGHFLDAVEKLTVTSRCVFTKQVFLLNGQSPENMQLVITACRIDAPLLVHFKRDAEAFFLPKLHNVDIHITQLEHYVHVTRQLCRRIRQNAESVLYEDIQKWKTGELPLVEFCVNLSEDSVQKMLYHLKQLCEISVVSQCTRRKTEVMKQANDRNHEETRLAFLFQDNTQCFIDIFSERHFRMLQFLSELEERAVLLDRMKYGASISTVTGSSVGILGGLLSIIGIVLMPFTAGASLACTFTGIGLGVTSGVNSLVTGITEIAVSSHHESSAQNILKRFKDDMIEILDCLEETSSSEGPLVQSGFTSENVDSVLNIVKGFVEDAVEVREGILANSVRTATSRAASRVSEIEMEAVDAGMQVARSGSKLAKGTLQIPSKFARVSSGLINTMFIGLDIYFICIEGISLANGSETEASQLIRSRAALWKSEVEAWKNIKDSLYIGKELYEDGKEILEKPFLP